MTISNEGSFHRLKIHKVTEEYAGKYKFEADGRKTEALIVVEGKGLSREFKNITYRTHKNIYLCFFFALCRSASF